MLNRKIFNSGGVLPNPEEIEQKHQQNGQAIGTGIGTAIGAVFGMPQVGGALGGTLGGVGGKLFGAGAVNRAQQKLALLEERARIKSQMNGIIARDGAKLEKHKGIY